jgi:hypothetical protein
MQANQIMRTTEHVQMLSKRGAAIGGEDARAMNGHRHRHRHPTEVVVLSVFLAERVETENQCLRVSLILMARGKLKTMVFVCWCSRVSFKSLFSVAARSSIGSFFSSKLLGTVTLNIMLSRAMIARSAVLKVK